MSLAFFGHASYAFYCTSKTSGFFHNPSTWNNCNNSAPQPTDNVTIDANHIVSMYGVNGNVNTLTILNNGILLKDINYQQVNITADTVNLLGELKIKS